MRTYRRLLMAFFQLKASSLAFLIGWMKLNFMMRQYKERE